jgi:hypothetical protein
MAIENRNLAVGTKLVARYRKQEYHAEVVEGEDGKLRYRLSDGREFKSPSAAGTTITNKACNGWAFWSVEGAVEEEVEAYPWADVPDEEPGEQEGQDSPGQPAEGSQAEPEQEQQPAGEAQQQEQPAEEKPTKFRRVPNQRGVPPGQVRYYCDECKMSFFAAVDDEPTTCPEGHRPDGSTVSQEASES